MIDTAIAAFREALGNQHVVVDPDAIRGYRQCTTPLDREIPVVLKPGSVEDVQRVVQAAAAHGVPLYPLSTGHNWGYGTSLPARDGSAIVDLGRMNRILHVDRALAYAVLEPGVTQQQLYDHLQAERIPLRLSPTGAGPSCSVLGNTLERGFSIGPYGDHFLAQCGLEAVLANGDVIFTGFGRDVRASHTYKWGVGPYLDGLFTQSNLGIVTKMGVWLMPEPEAFAACYFTAYSDAQVGPLVEAVRDLLFAGVFSGPVNVMHRNRVLIMLHQYPWDEMQGRMPLDEAIAARWAAHKRIGMWNGVGAISGSREQVAAARRTIARVLKGKVDRIAFLSDQRLRWLERTPAWLASALLQTNVPELLQTLRSSYGLMKGVPTEVALSLSYWRNRRPIPAGQALDPARDGCGLMWFAPVVPITAGDVRSFRDAIEPVFAHHGFECCITLTAVNERSFDCTLPLLFNRDDPDEVARAGRCYQELVDACLARGYIAYRLGLQSMDGAAAWNPSFWDTVNRVKQALDPQGILSPGRYAR